MHTTLEFLAKFLKKHSLLPVVVFMIVFFILQNHQANAIFIVETVGPPGCGACEIAHSLFVTVSADKSSYVPGETMILTTNIGVMRDAGADANDTYVANGTYSGIYSGALFNTGSAQTTPIIGKSYTSSYTKNVPLASNLAPGTYSLALSASMTTGFKNASGVSIGSNTKSGSGTFSFTVVPPAPSSCGAYSGTDSLTPTCVYNLNAPVTPSGGSYTTTSVASPAGYSGSRTWNCGTNGIWSPGAYTCTPPLVTYTLSVIKAGIGTGTVTSSPLGINCGAVCSRNFSGSVTLTATPAGGSIFVGWSGTSCSNTTGTCTVSMTASKSVTATFCNTGQTWNATTKTCVTPTFSCTNLPDKALRWNALLPGVDTAYTFSAIDPGSVPCRFHCAPTDEWNSATSQCEYVPPTCIPDCDKGDNFCVGKTYDDKNDCGTNNCPGTRYCDFNWKEVAPGN